MANIYKKSWETVVSGQRSAVSRQRSADSLACSPLLGRGVGGEAEIAAREERRTGSRERKNGPPVETVACPVSPEGGERRMRSEERRAESEEFCRKTQDVRRMTQDEKTHDAKRLSPIARRTKGCPEKKITRALIWGKLNAPVLGGMNSLN
jgi:hypothetical protein